MRQVDRFVRQNGKYVCDCRRDRTMSTIGYERHFNDFLQVDDFKKFMRFVKDGAPPVPAHYPRLTKVNAAGPPLIGHWPPCPGLPVSQFREMAGRGDVQILDVRLQPLKAQVPPNGRGPAIPTLRFCFATLEGDLSRRWSGTEHHHIKVSHASPPQPRLQQVDAPPRHSVTDPSPCIIYGNGKQYSNRPPFM